MESTNSSFFSLSSNDQLNNKHGLKPKLLKEVQPYLTYNELDKLPTPDEGKSRHSMRKLKEKKVLIRIAENWAERNHLTFRKEQMVRGRELIIKNDFKHLKIPRATITGNYLVETLIPITTNCQMAPIAYYMQNKQFFDQPVIELTKFLFQICLEDIVGNSGWMVSNWPQGVPRYDNILLYEKIKNNTLKHKIALIDLETLYYKDFKSKDYLKTAKDIILLFPYQYEVIIDTCQKLNVLNNNELIYLEDCKESAINSITRVYNSHGDFVIKNRELKIDPFTEFLDSPEAKKKLILEIRKEISNWKNRSADVYRVVSGNINLNNYTTRDDIKLDVAIVYLKVLGDTPEKYLDYCENEILYPMLKEISEVMKNATGMTKNQNPFTDPNMLSERVVTFNLNSNNERLIVNVTKDKNTYSFTAEELAKKFDQTLIKPISPEIRDIIIKHLLNSGLKYFEIQKMMLNLFKKNGFIADVFKDEKFTTILF